MKIHALQTGTVRLKHSFLYANPGRRRQLDLFLPGAWSAPMPILCWAIEHRDEVVLVDTGETAAARDSSTTPGERRDHHAADSMRQLNLALKFLLELTALVAIGIWGATLGNGIAAVLLAIVLPSMAAILWGVLAAPRAPRRLPLPLRAPFELSVFTLGVLALWEAVSADLLRWWRHSSLRTRSC